MGGAMDLERMLANCLAQQWRVKDLDWSAPPPAMSREKEIAVVQYFTNMVGIERLAGALFEEQWRRTTDPTLKQILGTFVKDELRHSEAAQLLADHYNVHRYRSYELDQHMRAFTSRFVDALHYFSA